MRSGVRLHGATLPCKCVPLKQCSLLPLGGGLAVGDDFFADQRGRIVYISYRGLTGAAPMGTEVLGRRMPIGEEPQQEFPP